MTSQYYVIVVYFPNVLTVCGLYNNFYARERNTCVSPLRNMSTLTKIKIYDLEEHLFPTGPSVAQAVGNMFPLRMFYGIHPEFNTLILNSQCMQVNYCIDFQT